ncbi:Histone-lysine N-methyltransferase ATX1 [Monoraphidium neglectum]|uniref:Histone-lysine N-methyltransferase ATX1 n=1 Tax=Monoraphidium neglectum TaxID=145388 RepID=A0A0D2LJY1_9CHLO|nr:Histone-lysine N-methyltransferase ATX1 [Monoraphidium neglectum]KIY92289.1 Histone-lysine N-methyltransferase ATX1 [Monoraphidium neglectum]|eukprot:XP_013891309.1 Histone-lysine N-methyltransferase ATX1 [Monoraphidium neglectum]
MVLSELKVLCGCGACARVASDEDRTFSMTQWEIHCGLPSAKKWKASVRVQAGGPGGGLAVGRWLEERGIETKFGRAPAGGAARVKSEQDPSYDPGQQQQQHQLHGAAPWVKHEADLEADLKLQLQLLMQPALWASDGGEDFELKLAAAAAAVAAANAAAAAAAAVAQASGLPVAGAVGPPFDPWYDVAKGRYKPIKVRWAGDRCAVCDSDVDYDCDRLVSCDGCGISAHQSCYGVHDLPGPDDMWLCRACELKEPTAPEPQCCLCPVAGGALKPTTIPGAWCHAACMQWIPEVTVVDPAR